MIPKIQNSRIKLETGDGSVSLEDSRKIKKSLHKINLFFWRE